MSEDRLGKWISDKLFGGPSKPAAPRQPAGKQPQSQQPNRTQPPHHAQQAHHGRPSVQRYDHSSRGNLPHGNPPRGNPQPQRTNIPIARTGSVTRVIPLGGLDEVGKNMMIFENDKDILIVDMGFQFPDQDMLGIDYIIPDVSYLDDKKERIRGILLTHGHLDHIGAIPYLIERLGFPPIFGTRLTLGIVERKLDDLGVNKKMVKLNKITADDVLRFGSWNVNFFRVNHSIPDAVGIVLRSPHGTFVHTGDFKFDLAPAGDQKPAEFDKIAGLGRQNVTALFSDSTNALKPGHTMSEQEVAKNLDEIIKNAPGRILIASFSSLIGRIQQVIDFAQRYRRTVYISGRSMLETLEVAKILGYLKYPKNVVNDVAFLNNKIPDHNVLILTTGSQGEDVSALARIGNKEHANVRIKKDDTVIISSTPIIGNERAVATVINNLCRQGAKVIHSKIMDVHTSGHGNQEDLKLMITMVKPRYLVPVHGEYFMRQGHRDLAAVIGYKSILVENGDVMEFRNGEGKVTGEKVQTNFIIVDGLGTGDIGTQVIADRQTMAENGVLVLLLTVDIKTKKLIRDPDMVSRGFIYMTESDEVLARLTQEAKETYNKIIAKNPGIKRGEVKSMIRAALDKTTHRTIDRRPLILPVIAEV